MPNIQLIANSTKFLHIHCIYFIAVICGSPKQNNIFTSLNIPVEVKGLRCIPLKWQFIPATFRLYVSTLFIKNKHKIQCHPS